MILLSPFFLLESHLNKYLFERQIVKYSQIIANSVNVNKNS